jgi:hypothetical protein
MNYQKVYDNIIAKAQSEDRKKMSCTHKNYVCYEDHHIIPRCMGGLDTKDNLVLLTLREHFLCHKLLAHIYPHNTRVVCAFKYMSSLKFRYHASSRDYEYAKLLYRSLPKSKKTKQEKLDAWFEINCSKDDIDNYIKSLKSVRYSPDFDRTIHIPFKH